MAKNTKKEEMLKGKIKVDFLTREVTEITSRALARRHKDAGETISKTVIAGWIKDEEWDIEREKVQAELLQKTTNLVVTSKAAAKAKSIRQAETIGDTIFEKLMLKLANIEDGVDEQKLISIKDFVSLQDTIGKLHGYVSGSGGGSKQINFIINVPPEYLTDAGREYVRRKMQNPTLTDETEQKKSITLDSDEYSVENGGKDGKE